MFTKNQRKLLEISNMEDPKSIQRALHNLLKSSIFSHKWNKMNSMGKLMNQNILIKNTTKSHARLIRRRNGKPWFQYLSPSKHKRFSSPTVVTGIDNVPPENQFQIDITKLIGLACWPIDINFETFLTHELSRPS